MLFGQVDGICERHGFRSPEIDDAGIHAQEQGRQVRRRQDCCPPIRCDRPTSSSRTSCTSSAGRSGTLVGLYETAIDQLCTWEVNGKTVRPKVIASTATIRQAGDQVHALFLRNANVFPPHGLDVRDNFFSLAAPVQRRHAGPAVHRHLRPRPAAEGAP